MAFGRPFLRRTNRPAIKIPPRKRRKLTYDEDEDEVYLADHADNGRQIILHARRDEEDGGLFDRTTTDVDVPDTAANLDSEALTSELQDLQKESDTAWAALRHLGNNSGDLDTTNEERAGTGKKDRRASRKRPRSQRGIQGLGLERESLIDSLNSLGQAGAGEYHNPLLDDYYDEEPRGDNPTTRMQSKEFESSDPSRTRNRTNVRKTSKNEQSRRSPSTSAKNVHFEDRQSMTPATIIADEQDTDDEDDEYVPSSRVDAGGDESDKENTLPNADISDSDEVCLPVSTTS